MTKIYTFLLAICVFAVGCKKNDDPIVAEDFLTFTNLSVSSAQEVPVVSSNATGTVTVKYEKNSNKLNYTINYSGITPTSMHFHKGALGVSGAVEKEVAAPYSSGMTGTLTLTDAQETDFLAGLWYLNIHSAAFAGGEIRGQIVAIAPEFVSFNNIKVTPNQEVPTNNSAASGSLNVSYEKKSNLLVYTLSYTGVTPTGMHFHKGAIGVSGAVEKEIAAPFSNGMTGSMTLTDAQETDLLGGLWYVNIHSAAFLVGEIRGQVVPSNVVVLANVAINGRQEIPFTTSTATGMFNGSYDKTTKKVTYTVSLTGINPSAMHIHKGEVGVAGAVITDINAAGGTTAALTAAQETDLLAGGTYVNAHTTAFAAGEIRGQILADNQVVFGGAVLGANEVPAVVTTATGNFTALYDKTTKKLSYTINYAGTTATNMHFHKAAITASGGVEIGITGPHTSGITGFVTLTAVQEGDLLAGLWYLNIHSAAFASGELRAQLVK